jgi:hypothetical protein
MIERPILFSAPMVRAIINGQKTQTRRVIKFQMEPTPYPQTDRVQYVKIGGKQYWWNSQHDHPAHVTKACPHGQPGDRLWVRETWAEVGTMDPGLIVYRADYPDCVPRQYQNVPPVSKITWKPSIHMFRRHSRILLEITGVRVERLQDISRDDGMAEGIVYQPDGGFGLADSTHYNFSDPRFSYQSLWEQINGEASWVANPWVWVVEFKRVMP